MKSKRHTHHLPFLVLASALFVHAEPAPPPRITLTKGAGNTWNASWQGVESRTYFVQKSTDMITWTYAPIIEFGNGTKTHAIDPQGAPRFFFRLQYQDNIGVTDAQEAREADFNGNGIPNFYEVETLLSDPFHKTHTSKHSDGDLMNDAEEYLAGRNLVISDQAADASSRKLDVFTLTSF